ncbi:unnamed protein product [Notodromas monacha]|uniref:Uncharacterized protein n=1 Tax=Notodromas monacha TaxID=399045 RepID=A0A7R9BEA2_9CRUS|nr:unnamed protein product [Notodromas monacha]CAG0913077.1 unnamed protein product [Notodromas monacha]
MNPKFLRKSFFLLVVILCVLLTTVFRFGRRKGGSFEGNPCQGLLEDGTLQGKIWQPSGCSLHKYSTPQIKTCLLARKSRGISNHFVFIGDSRIISFAGLFMTELGYREKEEFFQLGLGTFLHAKHDQLSDVVVSVSRDVFLTKTKTFFQNLTNVGPPSIVLCGAALWYLANDSYMHAEVPFFRYTLPERVDIFKRNLQVLWVRQDPVDDTDKPNYQITNPKMDLLNSVADDLILNSFSEITNLRAARNLSNHFAFVGDSRTRNLGGAFMKVADFPITKEIGKLRDGTYIIYPHSSVPGTILSYTGDVMLETESGKASGLPGPTPAVIVAGVAFWFIAESSEVHQDVAIFNKSLEERIIWIIQEPVEPSYQVLHKITNYKVDVLNAAMSQVLAYYPKIIQWSSLREFNLQQRSAGKKVSLDFEGDPIHVNLCTTKRLKKAGILGPLLFLLWLSLKSHQRQSISDGKHKEEALKKLSTFEESCEAILSSSGKSRNLSNYFVFIGDSRINYLSDMFVKMTGFNTNNAVVVKDSSTLTYSALYSHSTVSGPVVGYTFRYISDPFLVKNSSQPRNLMPPEPASLVISCALWYSPDETFFRADLHLRNLSIPERVRVYERRLEAWAGNVSEYLKEFPETKVLWGFQEPVDNSVPAYHGITNERLDAFNAAAARVLSKHEGIKLWRSLRQFNILYRAAGNDMIIEGTRDDPVHVRDEVKEAQVQILLNYLCNDFLTRSDHDESNNVLCCSHASVFSV